MDRRFGASAGGTDKATSAAAWWAPLEIAGAATRCCAMPSAASVSRNSVVARSFVSMRRYPPARVRRAGELTTSTGCSPMNEAAANISWLPSREVVARVAHHLGYPTENARLRIIRYIRARRITRGRTAEGWLVSLCPAAWREGADLDAANLELCLDELIAADLLPAPGGPEGPAERARLPADRAIAYLITGYLVEWGDWTPEMIREMERGEIKLGEKIHDGLLAWGQKSLQGPIEQLPRNDFRSEMVAMKRLPVNPLHLTKEVVRVDGKVVVSQRHRLPDYMGPPWCFIEVDWAGLKPLKARAEAEPELAPASTLAVSKSAQSSLEVPASVSPPPQEPTPIALLVEAALVASAAAAPKEQHHWQLDRAISALRKRYPPDDKVPVGKAVEAVRGEIDGDLADENKRLGKASPGWDVVKSAIQML